MHAYAHIREGTVTALAPIYSTKLKATYTSGVDRIVAYISYMKLYP